jgi:hypothetical protein
MTEYERNIIKKMEESGRCPVCHMMDNEEFDMLSHIQYDVTHNPEVREAIVDEGGFCEFHFRQFRKIANARSNSLLMTAMVERYSQPENEFTINCRFCFHLDEMERNLLVAVRSLLKDKAFREKYAAHTGLCLGHLDAVIRQIDQIEMKKWLARIQREQMKQEIPYLEQMATQSYYDTSNVARGSLVRTVEKFVGRRTLSM